MEVEVWRSIDGYNDQYRVSNHGRVQSNYTGAWRDLAQAKLRKRYRKVALCLDGTRKDIAVHRLVATAFIPNPHGKPEINHIDGDPSNNQLENLEWVTKSENMRHAFRVGLMHHRGEHNGRAILTADQVRAMRRIYAKGGKTQTEVGQMFGVSPYRAHQVLRNKQWTHIK